jgi:tetratricopeptide (TPR) repeat protein
LPAIWNIPYARNPFFLGRENELTQIRYRLQVGQAMALSQPQAIGGLGGIGKTQLALEYAYRYHQDYIAVLWAHAENTQELISSYVAIASLLRLPERDVKEQNIAVQAVKIWLQTHRDWLLILDNADDLALLPEFLPPVLGGHLLLTTRTIATGRLAHRLEIETLPPESGALFLLRRAALLAPDATLEHTTHEERELALQISQELGGLPLALDQAGAYLEETGTNLISYWQIYQQHRDEMLRRRGGLVTDHPAPVATTWLLSFQQVEEKNPAAADLLRVCAYLSPDAIAEEILTAGASLWGSVLSSVAGDAFQLNQVIEVLLAYSLVRRDPKAKTLSIHRLVQAVLQDIQKEDERRIWAKRVMLAVNAAFPEPEYGIWSQCERLLPHALLAIQYIETDQIVSEEAGRLLHEVASYLNSRARYSEAEALYQRALQIREQLLGLEDPQTADSLDGLANLYRDQGKYVQAKQLYQRALQIREQLSEPKHLLVANSLNNLAILYKEEGKYIEAEALYQQALTIREQQLGSEHLLVATSLNGLALLYKEEGKYVDAEPLYQRALQIQEQQLEPEHLLIATSLNNLAILYWIQGKYAEAEQLYQRSLAISEQAYGEDHPERATDYNNLGIIYCEQGKYKESIPLLQQALRIWEHHLGVEHPHVARALNNLAELYTIVGEKYGEAETLYKRALHIWSLQLEPEHPDGANPLNGLAELYCKQSRYVEAEPLYQRALTILEQHLGLEHPLVAYSLSGLANLYRDQGKYGEAEPLLQRALHIRQHGLGSKHPETAETMHDLARLWEEQNNNEDAFIWYTQALTIREQVLGAQHPKTIETRTRLIALLHALGQHEKAARFEMDLASS